MVRGIEKTLTHIEGLDLVLHGGIPTGRVTLVGGGPGTGKTLLGLEFLYRSALTGHPGIFLSFEETAANLRGNVASFGWDLPALEKNGRLYLMEGSVAPETVISGTFSIGGFLAIIRGKADEMGGSLLVIDALDVLMGLFEDSGRQRQQVNLLHRWLAEQNMTVILTSKKGATPDNGVRTCEYLDFLADCVIYLDQRINKQIITKRLQVVKYRGSAYDGNEVPFAVVDDGLYFNAVSNMNLNYEPSEQRFSSGIDELDEMLGGGYKKGSCILLDGASGVGKTALASTLARDACASGQKVLYVNFEESQSGLFSGMQNMGIDLEPAATAGMLETCVAMPESRSLEAHLYRIDRKAKRFQPNHLIVDAISALTRIAEETYFFDFLLRLICLCRAQEITSILLNQSRFRYPGHGDDIGFASLIDTILILSYQDREDAVQRMLQIRKSRGSQHSNRRRPFLITGRGLSFLKKPLAEIHSGSL